MSTHLRGRSGSIFRRLEAYATATCCIFAVGLLLAGCGGNTDTSGSTPVANSPLTCDDTLKSAYKAPDANTTVLLVKAFKKGDIVALSNSPATTPPVTSPVDMCLVKLLVGPGNPGPAEAPSTSSGIGIEIWLPSSTTWNQRIRDYGSGGWAGGYQGDATRLDGTGSANLYHISAVGKGYAVGTSDHGHGGSNAAGGNGSFAMNSDGSINTTLWQDFSERSLHVLAVETKAFVKAYYGRAQQYAYWDGFSTGGRQGYKLAQKFPGDFDGILAGAPAFNWSRFITNELYPQIVMKHDLGYVIPSPKLNAANGAAVAACGGSSLGFLVNPLQCRYDPTRDASALCSGVQNGGITGTSTNLSTCLTLAEAIAINKMWYGQTTDGTAPDPATDNSSSSTLASNQLWWGLTRGTSLGQLAGSNPFPISTDQVALELQDPSYAQSDFANATGNGTGKWSSLDFAGLSNAYIQGLTLQLPFSDINTDNPDLSGLLAGGANGKGAKVLSYHGMADQLIPTMGSVNYFDRAARQVGSVTTLQQYNRLFLVPGLAHDSTFATSASIDPLTSQLTTANKVPLPQASTGRDELFNALTNWVENGVAPTRIELSSADGGVTLPICSYPQMPTFIGGIPTQSSSYICR